MESPASLCRFFGRDPSQTLGNTGRYGRHCAILGFVTLVLYNWADVDCGWRNEFVVNRSFAAKQSQENKDCFAPLVRTAIRHLLNCSTNSQLPILRVCRTSQLPFRVARPGGLWERVRPC